MNTTGSVSYSASCKGLAFPAIQIESPAPSIDRVEIKTEPGDRITLTVQVRDIYDIQDATPITLPIVERFLNRISFKHGCQIGEVHSTGFSLPQKKKKRHRVLASLLQLSDHLEGTITLGEDSRGELQEIFVAPESERDNFLTLYRVAINKTDSVARFVLLYNLLLSICNDRQAAVDVQIRRIQHDVEETISPIHGNPETIYTRLRNEVSHVRDGTCPAKTVKEIDAHIASFQNIIKQSIP